MYGTVQYMYVCQCGDNSEKGASSALVVVAMVGGVGGCETIHTCIAIQ